MEMRSEQIPLQSPASAFTRKSRDHSRIYVTNPAYDRPIYLFMAGTAVMVVAALFLLPIEWHKVAERAGKMVEVVSRVFTLDFTAIDLTLTAFLESVNLSILSTIYSIALGIVFGALTARNITPWKPLSMILSAFFAFIRAVPTTIWVLLMLVCLGFGPAPGIAGLIFHATAFFARVFAQCFEEVPEATIEALRASGANRVQIFFGAIMPASLNPIIAWSALRFEINFSESAILGMVGAGGIGYTIMAAMSGYKFGRAGVAIVLVFLFAYVLELCMAKVRKGMKV